MKKSLTPLILTLLIIALAFICMETNPTDTAYTTWLKEEYIPNTSTSNEIITEVFAQLLGPSLVKESTTRNNYIFFSIYEIHLNDAPVKVLGLLDHFFVLPS
ncbi:MAG: DUF4359 domain-containing protein [Cellulosilyticum sp.]|nr:DUF4359 domain-containing protein [Cellulosilyticum sp.]